MYSILLVLLSTLLLSAQCQHNDASTYPGLDASTAHSAAMPALICPYTNVLRTLRFGTCAAKSMPYIPFRPSSSSSLAQGKFTYRIGASSAAKRAPQRQPQYNRDYFLYPSTNTPAQQPYLRSTKDVSGEDAFFATTIGPGNAHAVSFGVADGVGGWQDQGVDPSDFSHGIVGYMAGSAHLFDEKEEKKRLRPLALLQTAFDAVMANPRIVAGGSTVSLAVADETGALECANLGDSSFLLLSPGKITHRSPIQTHAFNTPYQLSKIPAQLQAQHAIFGSQHFAETPSQADVTRHSVRHGDIVVFATDGVWDNLSAQDALGIVTKVMCDEGYWFHDNSSGEEMMLDEGLVRKIPQEITKDVRETFLPGLLATAIMREAKSAGLDRRRNSPFAKEVNARYPDEGWEGGKPDDIAVVVCIAVQEDGEVQEKPIKAKL